MSLPPLPYTVPDSIMQKAANIRLAIFDVDGVLTDGRLIYGKDGEQLKTFHVLDGHGLKMLMQANIDVAIISARKSLALQKRLDDLGIQHSYLGVSDKISEFNRLLEKLSLNTQQCAFTGDDVIDLSVMQKCGLAFSVPNGHFIAKHAADWISPVTGGQGAVRTICDLLLYSQNSYPLAFNASQ